MKKIFYIIASVILLWGCMSEPVVDKEPETPYESEERVLVSMATRSINIDAQYPYGRGENEELPYFFENFDPGAILYISQQGTSLSPNLYYNSDGTGSKKEDSIFPDTNRSNLYIYEYEENKDANWDTGYNFVPYVNKKGENRALNWGAIRNNGSRGNAFWFYAIFTGNNRPNFRINGWQNNDSNIGRSAKSLAKLHDVMGAYHASSSLYTRMRFKLYHLTILTHITLLVPAKQAEPNGGYSGFDDNAFINNGICGLSNFSNFGGVWIGVPQWSGHPTNGLLNYFNIDWVANRSSDNEAPLVTSPGGGSSTPCLYMLKGTPKEPFLIDNVKSFYPGSEIETDSVRRYEFIAYIAAQQPNKLNNALLSIRLLTPGSNATVERKITSGKYYYTMDHATFADYYYYGDTNKKQDQLTEGSDLDFTTQGIYQHLTLYIPREGNKTLLVSAKIEPWNETHTDMTLVPREDDTTED